MGCTTSKNKQHHHHHAPARRREIRNTQQNPETERLNTQYLKITNKLIHKPDSGFLKLLDFIENLHQDTKIDSKTSHRQEPNFWAKGVGYGHGSNSSVKRDVEYSEKRIECITNSIAALVGFVDNNRASMRVRTDLEASAFPAILVSYFGNDSLLDIQNKLNLYLSLLKVVEILCEWDPIATIFTINKSELLVHFARLEKISTEFLKRVEKLPSTEGNSTVKVLPQELLKTWNAVGQRLNLHSSKNIEEQPTNLPQMTEENTLALTQSLDQQVEEDETRKEEQEDQEEQEEQEEQEQEPVKKTVEESVSDVSISPPPSPHPVVSTTTTTTTVSEPVSPLILAPLPAPAPVPTSTPAPLVDEEKLYVESLKEMQFDSISLAGPDNKYLSHFYSQVILNSRGSSEKVMRLVMEMNSLSSSLPLCKGSSIFVRVDEERLDVIKALITGPQDTPYAGGCFEFDIFLTDTYPREPPLVQFLTTGGGRARFNPNLYEGGKVCLSLLGTWSGGYGENWTPQSTLLQVLVSIQSLILVSEPYFNEPGYESSRGSLSGTAASEAYSNTIRSFTIRHAMIDQLQNHGSVFRDVIQRHFALRKEAILHQVSQWDNNGSFYHQLKSLIEPL